MGEVHSLIMRHGVETARSMAATKAERNAIDAAASILAEEDARMGVTPLCHRSCRPDRIGTFGGAGRRTWLDTDSDIRIG
jgi:hypothetical protein